VGSPEDNPPSETTNLDGDNPGLAISEGPKGWSKADRRMFALTFYGSLAANVGVVLLVGAAIALVRFNSERHHKLWLQLIVDFSAIIAGLIIGLAAHSIAPRIKTWQVMLISYVVGGLLILIGYAAGIGK